MSETRRFNALPPDPVELAGLAFSDTALTGNVEMLVQFDEPSMAGNKVYFRVDKTATAGDGAVTVAEFKPQGVLTDGGAESLDLDPASTWYFHALVATEAGVVTVGGAGDRLMFTPKTCVPN